MNRPNLIAGVTALALAVLAQVPAYAAKPKPFLLPGSPTLVRDLNGALSSNPSRLFTARGSTFFIADDGFYGSELWVTDGTNAGTTFVKDMTPGPSSSAGIVVGTAVALGDVALFIGATSGGYQVWRTDGTAAGTYPVIPDINGGTYSVNAALNGNAYFTISQGTTTLGIELWRSDGTVAGTSMVKDVNPLANANGAYTFALVANGSVYFSGFDGTNGGLWKSDGTGPGTVTVKVIRSGAEANIRCMTEALGRLFFSADDGTNGSEPWVSDGTAAGTFMLRNIHTTAATGSNPCDFTEMNGQVYFAASSAGEGTELWKTDGTNVGTVLVKDIWPGATGSTPRYLHAVGNRLVFAANDGTTGNEPWVSDGTAAGTARLADITTGAVGGFTESIGAAGGYWYFNGTDGTNGIELYRTDGLTVTSLGDLNPGAGSFAARRLETPRKGSIAETPLAMNGLPVFRATTAAGGTELFYVNSAGVVTSVGEIAAGALSSTPQFGTVTNGVLFFDADDGVNGRELWKLPPVNPDVQKISVTAAGKSDILYQHTDGRIYGWAVNGGTLLANSPLTALGSSYRVKGVGDFDGAGPDGVVLRDGAGNNRIVRFGAAGNTMTVAGQNDIVPAGLNWEIAAVGDFDGDGKDDILWREVGGYNFMYSQFDATTGSVVQNAVTGLGIDWKVAGVADFDGDGKADIFWRNINGANAIWLMNGPAVKQVLNVAGLGTDWSIAGIADFDRDGKPDIFWRNIAGYNGIWFMDKNVVSRVINVAGVTPDWRIVGTGDYNGDGFADILWEQTVNGTRVVWSMNAGIYQGEAVLPGTGDNIAWQVVNPVSNR